MRWWPVRKRDEDLARELRSDLELEEEQQRSRGLSREDAHYAALRAFGNSTLIREQTHEACESYINRRASRSIVASRMLRRGFSTSSERVEMPSNPIYVSTATEVQAKSAFHVNDVASQKRTEEKSEVGVRMRENVPPCGSERDENHNSHP